VGELDVRRYLETELPALLALAGDIDRRAVVQWIVVDREDCDLAYRFGEDGLEVSNDLADDVDLTLAFVSADLIAFAQQKLDVARALRSRRLKITGDESLLAWMAERLTALATLPVQEHAR
jgi:ubiquinone biosynthesis protein UbiJ